MKNAVETYFGFTRRFLKSFVKLCSCTRSDYLVHQSNGYQ